MQQHIKLIKKTLQYRKVLPMDKKNLFLKKLDESQSEALIFLGKVGVGISCEHLLNDQITSYDGIFLMLDQEDLYRGNTLTLPETLGVRIRFHGQHTEAPQEYRKLLDYNNSLRMHGA